ncbi:MBL fold metallo-hydrolase, partial [Pseudomonas aeruginosa]
MPFLYRLASLLIALLVLPVQAAEMRVALLRTSGVETLDALTVDGGSWVRRVPLSHTAVLIEHHAATLLFDTGLGRDIDAQFRADMPWWAAPLFAYQKVVPARDQLDAAGIRVDRILLSHAHWDHASGLVDFPEVPVWAPYEEIAFSRIATPPAAFPSQFRHGVRWRPYSFDPRPFMGFD